MNANLGSGARAHETVNMGDCSRKKREDYGRSELGSDGSAQSAISHLPSSPEVTRRPWSVVRSPVVRWSRSPLSRRRWLVCLGCLALVCLGLYLFRAPVLRGVADWWIVN